MSFSKSERINHKVNHINHTILTTSAACDIITSAKQPPGNAPFTALQLSPCRVFLISEERSASPHGEALRRESAVYLCVCSSVPVIFNVIQRVFDHARKIPVVFLNDRSQLISIGGSIDIILVPDIYMITIAGS